jgi:hypothetical protein
MNRGLGDALHRKGCSIHDGIARNHLEAEFLADRRDPNTSCIRIVNLEFLTGSPSPEAKNPTGRINQAA